MNFHRELSANVAGLRILTVTRIRMPMPQFPPLIDSRIVRPTETALALGVVSDLELLRLKTLARWYARGLPPDVTWEDLLQESVTRILLGKRAVPEGVAVVAFVAGVMRSLRSEHWQRIRKRTPHGSELIDPAAGPERALIAQQELAAIQGLFADDAVALLILEGLAGGLTADEIRDAAQLSDTEYASARKRMRRVLLREGLTCTPK
jgi:DNA-directed RNA polymerase specialized sigma24 family protein